MVRSNSTLQRRKKRTMEKKRKEKAREKKIFHAKSHEKKINKAAGMRWKFLSVKHKIEINKLIKSTFTRCIIVGSC